MAVLVALASLIQGLAGFAFALFIVAVSLPFLEAKEIIPLVAFMATFNSSMLLWQWRKDINFKQVLPILVVAALCVPLGALFLKSTNREVLVRVLGATIIGLSLLSLFKSRVGNVFQHPKAKWVVSVISGLCSGAFSIGGPPVVVYAYNCSWPIKEARANLQLIFIAISTTACITHVSTGLLTPASMLSGLYFLPLIYIFGRLGARLAKRVPPAKLVLGINIFLILIGFYYLVKG